MVDSWEDFQTTWQLGDDKEPVTDASLAENYQVEGAITDLQEATRKVTDALAALSSARNTTDDLLRKFREGVILANSYARYNDLDGVKDTLKELCDL